MRRSLSAGARLIGALSVLALSLALLAPLPALAQDAAVATVAPEAAAAPLVRGAYTQLLTSVISSVGFGPELLWGAGLQLRLDHTPGGESYRVGFCYRNELPDASRSQVAATLQPG